MIKVKLYRKDGCWLCDHAEELLNGIKIKHGLEVQKIDIGSTEELYELYRFDIPVVEFPDGSTVNSRIKKSEILRLIELNQASKN